jgi:TolB-like protein/DNA-binding winged helix-turn-helix (wHTH) protein/Tfp pilus assembly protein PilF
LGEKRGSEFCERLSQLGWSSQPDQCRTSAELGSSWKDIGLGALLNFPANCHLDVVNFPALSAGCFDLGSPSNGRHRLRFGLFEADLASGELFKHGRLIHIQEQPFRILAMLLERPGEVVSREEVRKKLWPEGTFVDFDEGLDTALKKLRQALGDSSNNPVFIETIPRRGYRFIGSLRGANGDSLPETAPAVVASATSRLRNQRASHMPADLQRLKRDSDSVRMPVRVQEEKSLVVLYFENLSRDKEDEYFRDGMTEDVITELSKIRKLHVFPRAAVFAYRDRVITAPQVGQELNATYVLGGSIRRAGNRLRITAQLVETRTGYSAWAERFDRELKDLFEVQDEIARSITQALRITLSSQEEEAISRKPTEDLQAYDYYLRGRSFARRETRSDLELAIQMFEHAVMLDRHFALAHTGVAAACARIYEWHEHDSIWLERALANCEVALTLQPGLAEALAARALLFYVQKQYDEAIQYARLAIESKGDCEGAYCVLGGALFASDRWTEAAALVERAVEANGDDYNLYTPFLNVVRALGPMDAARSLREQEMRVLEHYLQVAPEDARARILLSGDYAYLGRKEAAVRQLQQAMAIRSHDSNILYNAACTYGLIGEKADALALLKKAKEFGYTNWGWVARDPDLACLHDDPVFQGLVAGAG